MKTLGNKVIDVYDVDVESFSLGLRFQDGSRGRVSLKCLFENPKGLAAEILRGAFFDKCFVEGGGLAWPNGFELCPDSLKEWMLSQRRQEKSRAA